MASITVSDKAVRTWATDYGYDVGTRGPLPKSIILAYAAHQELTTLQKLHRAEQRIAELEAQSGRDQKVIKNLQETIRQLREELAEWKDRATILAGIIHSEG